MTVKDIGMTPEDCQLLANIDNSIRQRALDFTSATLKARALEDQLRSLYGAREGFIAKKIEEAGIQHSSVMQTGVTPDGDSWKLSVMVKDDVPSTVPGQAPAQA